MTGFDADQIVSAANFTAATWLIILSGVAFSYGFKLKRSANSDARIMVFGLGLEALGWSIHRGYWGFVRRMRADLSPDDGNALYIAWSNSWVFQIVSFSMVMLGLIMILTPVWKNYIGSGWRIIPAALVLSTFWFFLASELYFKLPPLTPDF